MSETFSLTVNGKAETVSALPDTPLIYVLRNQLGLKGVRYGCGLEQCGACAVMIDGEATFCCNRPVGEITEKDIVTVEALSNDPVGAAGGKVCHPNGQSFGYGKPEWRNSAFIALGQFHL